MAASLGDEVDLRAAFWTVGKGAKRFLEGVFGAVLGILLWFPRICLEVFAEIFSRMFMLKAF